MKGGLKMKNKLFNKSVVFTIIVILVGLYIIPSANCIDKKQPSLLISDVNRPGISNNESKNYCRFQDDFNMNNFPGIIFTNIMTYGLKIDISSGIAKLKTVITNTGGPDLPNVLWNISVTGGLFGLINISNSGTLSSLRSGDSKVVTTMPIIGLGKIKIIVTAAAQGTGVTRKIMDGFISGLFLSLTPLESKTFYVGGSGHNNYTKIQDAINDANEGDTVFVYSGTYKEGIIVNKSINLIGQNKYNTFIDRFGLHIPNVISVSKGVNGVFINGFTFVNSSTDYAGVNILSDYNIITGNIFKKNSIGICLTGAANNTIYDNIIYDGYNGIRIDISSNDNIISENNITNIHGMAAITILRNSNNNIIFDNTIIDTTYGVTIGESAYNIIQGNDLIDSEWKIISISRASRNLISNNLISGCQHDGVAFEFNANSNIIYQNVIANNERGVFLWGGCKRNIVSYNDIIDNDFYGVRLLPSSGYGPSDDNIFYYNNFVGNEPRNAYDECDNLWNDNYPTRGNYWDDYTGVDIDGDGFGDTPYNIPGGSNQDNYPLMDIYGGENFPPNKPRIDGSNKGKVGDIYNFSFETDDPEFDDILYIIEWGDGTDTDWIGSYESGESVTLSHTWSEKGKYTIRCKAKDVLGEESDWGKLEVTMPMNQQSQNYWFFQFLQNHPRMFPILRQILSFIK